MRKNYQFHGFRLNGGAIVAYEVTLRCFNNWPRFGEERFGTNKKFCALGQWEALDVPRWKFLDPTWMGQYKNARRCRSVLWYLNFDPFPVQYPNGNDMSQKCSTHWGEVESQSPIQIILCPQEKKYGKKYIVWSWPWHEHSDKHANTSWRSSIFWHSLWHTLCMYAIYIYTGYVYIYIYSLLYIFIIIYIYIFIIIYIHIWSDWYILWHIFWWWHLFLTYLLTKTSDTYSSLPYFWHKLWHVLWKNAWHKFWGPGTIEARFGWHRPHSCHRADAKSIDFTWQVGNKRAWNFTVGSHRFGSHFFG